MTDASSTPAVPVTIHRGDYRPPDWQVPDVIVIPGGNLGNVSALGAGFEMMRALGVVSRKPRIVASVSPRRSR